MPAAPTVVVVDNGSIDGSAQLLADFSAAGLCTVLANDRNCGHGPGLNQAMSFLAHRAEIAGAGPNWVWVLDSDCVVARPDVLSAPLAKAVSSGASSVGEYQWDQWHGVERFGAQCLLFEPATAWREPVSVISDGGDPFSSCWHQPAVTASFLHRSRSCPTVTSFTGAGQFGLGGGQRGQVQPAL